MNICIKIIKNSKSYLIPLYKLHETTLEAIRNGNEILIASRDDFILKEIWQTHYQEIAYRITFIHGIKQELKYVDNKGWIQVDFFDKYPRSKWNKTFEWIREKDGYTIDYQPIILEDCIKEGQYLTVEDEDRYVHLSNPLINRTYNFDKK